MKKICSTVLAFVLALTLVPIPQIYGAYSGAASADTTLPDDALLSGQLYRDFFGEGDDYEIIFVEHDEENNQFSVDYIALTDTVLLLRVIEEDSDQVLEDIAVPAPAGQGTVVVPTTLDSYPEYYRAEAHLQAGGDTYIDGEHTRSYQLFLNASPDDFAGRVIVDYGIGTDETQNFAVVREDVKVVYVDSMDEVQEVDRSDCADLFGEDAGEETQTFLFDASVEAEALEDLQSGDKILILPRDNINDLKALVVEDAQDAVDLFSDVETEYLAVTVLNEEPNVQEFYDYIRIHAEVEADTDDLDTSTADDDVEVIEPNELELMGWINSSRSSSRYFNLGRKSFNGITVEDNFTLSATCKLTVEWSGIWLPGARATATASVSATNVFRIYSSYSASVSREWPVGTINVGSAYGITFSIPVSITFYASFGAGFNYTATQRAYAEVTARYSSGRTTISTYKSASADRRLTAYASATVRLGVKPGIRAKVIGFDIDATLTAEVGLQVTGSYRNRTFSGALAVYIRPGFRFHFFWWTPIDATWGIYTSNIASISFSRAVYDTMDDLAELTADEVEARIEQYEEDGYAVTISSPEQLRLFAEYVNSGKPTQGIDFIINTSAASFDMSGQEWTPVGTDENPFQGTFDGGGIPLSDLRINGAAETAGLFGCVDGAIVHDVILDGAQISGGAYTGGVAGIVRNQSRLFDIGVTGTVTGTGTVGGIAGKIEDSSLLNAYSDAVVTGGTLAGGIAGSFAYSEIAGQIANCYSAGSVAGAETLGAIVGKVIFDDAESEETFDPVTRYTVPGVTLCYYAANEPAAGDAGGCAIGATALAAEQIAAGGSLLDSLNNWYRVYGAIRLEEESVPETAPAASATDYYSKWAQEGDADPRFSPRGTTYKLTVSYVYEDGTPIDLPGFDPTVLYLQLGEQFDVDPKPLDGYYTNVDEGGYTGYMNPDPTVKDYEWNTEHDEEFEGLDFRIVYVKNESYSGTLSDLSVESPAVSGSEYAIASREDLAALAAYVNAGGNTEGVTFKQTQNITDASGLTPIGTDEHPFNGTYLGNDLDINLLSAPLFGIVKNAKLNGLHLKGTLGEGAMLGLAAVQAEKTSLYDVTAVVSFIKAPAKAGGILGKAVECVVDRCTVNGTVEGNVVAGGIVAEAMGGTILNSSVGAVISGSGAVGGIVGAADQTAIENDFTSEEVTGAIAGGIAGTISGGKAENCYCMGALFGAVTNAPNAASLFYTGVTAVASGSVSGCEKFDEEETSALADWLNVWVEGKTSARYLTWALESGEDDLDLFDSDGFPVFAQAYESWLMEFNVKDGNATFQFDRKALGDGNVYLAFYDQNGKMLKVQPVIDSGELSIPAPDTTDHAKIFVVDDEFSPVSKPVRNAD